MRNGDELLDLVIESLRRYQRELQGDLPAVINLWDYSAKSEPRPRDEGHLADDIARHLKRDLAGRGIAVGCELVVRRGGKGRASGMRTDIYVTAVLSSSVGTDRADGEVSTAVIEVKGSWHEEVKTAMADTARRKLPAQLRGSATRALRRRRLHLRPVSGLRGEPPKSVTRRRRRASTTPGGASRGVVSGGIHLQSVVLDTSLPAT